MSYVTVCENEEGLPVELETEEDENLLVSSLQAQFPNAVGLRYLPDPNSSIYRGVRCVDGRLKPPKDGWHNTTFYCTYTTDSKRKGSESADDEPVQKKSRGPREVKCSDLIVLGLSFSTTDESLKQYFEDKYGPLLMSLVKTDLHSKRSKGFGFIRFIKYEDQVKALSARKHEIDGRWVTIKPPYAKEGVESSLPSKVFISRLTPDMTKEDLTTYFAKYGEIADVFFPKTPFRAFAFLTFVSPESADQACEEAPHIIENVSLSVVHATDQQKKPSYSSYNDRNGRGNRGGYERYSSRDRYGGGRYRGGNYNGNSSRDSYRDYDSYDRRDSYYGPSNKGSAPPEEIATKILAAALNNPNTISNLLNNLGAKGGPSGGGGRNDMDYQGGRDYDDSNDYSYQGNKYGYAEDKGYGGPNKYGGGGGGNLRY